jgi:hypothetical protein
MHDKSLKYNLVHLTHASCLCKRERALEHILGQNNAVRWLFSFPEAPRWFNLYAEK